MIVAGTLNMATMGLENPRSVLEGIKRFVPIRPARVGIRLLRQWERVDGSREDCHSGEKGGKTERL